MKEQLKETRASYSAVSAARRLAKSSRSKSYVDLSREEVRIPAMAGQENHCADDNGSDEDEKVAALDSKF